MDSWEDVLNGPCYIINLDRNPERWSDVQEKIKKAGYTNVHRWTAVDGKNPSQLKDAWNQVGNPSFSLNDQEFVQYPGKQGCFLSHVLLWKKMIDEQIPWITVFEDDVLFHPEWTTLAPQYFEQTPTNFDVLYLGAQFEFHSKYHIDKGPVFCTHAMMVSLEGAKKLYRYCTQAPNVYTVDCMIIDWMKRPLKLALQWYVWNGMFFPTDMAKMDKGWTKRNGGLVFQDERYGSEVRPW